MGTGMNFRLVGWNIQILTVVFNYPFKLKNLNLKEGCEATAHPAPPLIPTPMMTNQVDYSNNN